ncbi:gasdermin-D isoform X2 [Zalophus californianus]|uniref:Gasdermin-D isoform X2 n=1 Tax=Zalophus californianus TaxID=9704 RepID=A0A6J2EQP1_ZALCA|nr:gasdermin-D isoform X2 [Zalophus californianus]XP_027467977.1 gasdermin-D isoform X2 [Zalophus californianus]
MASAFESVIKSVVRELDHSGELIPVDSLRSSTSFQPYYLLGRRCSRSWFWKPRYKSINLSIRDILEPDAPEPAVKQSAPIHIYDSMDGELQASGELEAPARGRCAGGAAIFDTFSLSMKVRTLRVDPNIWDAMKQERHLRQPEHKVLQQLRNCGNDVFVVTEVLQTQKEVKVTQTRKQEGSGQFALLGTISFQGQGQGHRSRKKTVTIPSGSILAFQVAQLLIDSDWDVLLFPDKTHKKQRTFRLPKEGHQLTSGAGSQSPLSGRFKLESDGFVEDWSAVTGDFRGLQAEVRAQAQVLQGLSKELCERLLAGLVQVLREEPALRTLEDALERGLCCGSVARLDGPVDAVLECLVHTSGELEVHLAGPILYLVEALAVLSESQRELLVEMLETGGLSGQFKLQVGSVLEQSTPWQERRDVSLLQELLGSSWDPEAPAWVLLEECGLGVQVDVPQVCWEPQAQGRTCALYACLALLFGLSQDCC